MGADLANVSDAQVPITTNAVVGQLQAQRNPGRPSRRPWNQSVLAELFHLQQLSICKGRRAVTTTTDKMIHDPFSDLPLAGLKRKPRFHRTPGGFLARFIGALSLCLIIARLGARGATFESFDYEVRASGVTITGGKDPQGGILQIPDSIPGAGPVTAVGDFAFYLTDGVAEVLVPGSVVAIGECAFGLCSNLKRVSLSGVKEIGFSAFSECDSLVEVHLPDSLRVIGDEAFRSCRNLTHIELPEGLDWIGVKAFEDTPLGSVTVPNSVGKIGYDAFAFTTGNPVLTNVTFSGPKPSFCDLMYLGKCFPLLNPEKVLGAGARTNVTLRFPASRFPEWASPGFAGMTRIPFDDTESLPQGVPVDFDSGPPKPGRRVYGWLENGKLGPLNDTNQWVVLCYSTSTNLPYEWKFAGASTIGDVPGTWRPKRLRLPGVAPGQHVTLMVGALDMKVVNDEVLGMSLLRGEAFDYVYDPTIPTGASMTEYSGLYIPEFCAPGGPPSSATFEVAEDGFLEFPDYPGDFAIHVVAWKLPNVDILPRWGSLDYRQGTNPFFSVVRYTPAPHTYGDDVVYRYGQGGFCDPPSDFVSPSTIRILPSPRRPYLAVSGAGRTRQFALRGLAGRTYTVQRSTDLEKWTAWADVTGNSSEVLLPESILPDASPVYLRCVEKAAR